MGCGGWLQTLARSHGDPRTSENDQERFAVTRQGTFFILVPVEENHISRCRNLTTSLQEVERRGGIITDDLGRSGMVYDDASRPDRPRTLFQPFINYRSPYQDPQQLCLDVNC